MRDAAQEALTFAAGRDRPELDRDRMLVLTLVKSIEIVGEAASRVSEDARSRLGAIPWEEITGMRNRLIHAYFDVDLDRVWDTIEVDLPPLITQLDSALSGENPSGEE